MVDNESELRSKYAVDFDKTRGHTKAICVKCGTTKKLKVHYWQYKNYVSKCSDGTGIHIWKACE